MTTAAFVVGDFTRETLAVDPQASKIEVAVVSTAHNFRGELTNYQASVGWEREPYDTLPTKADLTFDFKDLKTGSAGRDKDMLAWLNYTVNPRASFHLTGWKQEVSGAVALGELTIHGIKKSIQMPVTVKHTGENYEISGNASLDYRDFRLPLIRRALLLSVDPHLKVDFVLKGKLTPAN